jgi:GGDEF domain-containing protein/CHASE3 domain sensor protein
MPLFFPAICILRKRSSLFSIILIFQLFQAPCQIAQAIGTIRQIADSPEPKNRRLGILRSVQISPEKLYPPVLCRFGGVSVFLNENWFNFCIILCTNITDRQDIIMKKSFGPTQTLRPLPKRTFYRSLQQAPKGFLHLIGHFLGYGRSRIEVKITLGYLPLIVAVILIAINAMTNLMTVNELNRRIVENDMVLLDAANQMADQVLAKESYARRYILLGSGEMLDLFNRYDREFKIQINRILGIPQGYAAADNIQRINGELNRLYRIGVESGEFSEALDLQIQKKLSEIMAIIRYMETSAKTGQQAKMRESSRIGGRALKTTGILLCLGILFGIGPTLYTIRSILNRLHQLKVATREISEGRFDHIMPIKERDELADLARDFGKMAERLAVLERTSVDMNPLTRLPGNIAIENELKSRLEEGDSVAFCLIDIDNFKAYNDRYGYIKGNEVIRALAEIVKDAVADCGIRGDFVGHIGGDDFALITRPEDFTTLCKKIIRRFDRTIPGFYDDTERRRGYICAHSRQGSVSRFPIMSVSIAVVTNETNPDLNVIQVGEIAAELKMHAKTLPGSVFIRDRRESLT